MSKKKLTISYNSHDGELDIRQLLWKLQNHQGSIYYGRSLNEILKMILKDALPTEIKNEEQNRLARSS